MASKLRPLQLPLLVERQKLEDAPFDLDGDYIYAASIADVSSPDFPTPVTPPFSRGHVRGSSSSSSFDLSTPATSEGPSSPTQLSQKAGAGNWVLPDVQEEPLEPQFSDCDSLYNSDDCASDHFDLYNCLCDEPCIHQDADLVQSATDIYASSGNFEYDIGFLSDSDFNSTLKVSKKRQSRPESPFSGLSQRIGSRFPPLTRWKSKRKASATQSPVSDFGFDLRPAFSRTASSTSRSSSLSTTSRFPRDRTQELGPPPTSTPALSFYESSDSVSPSHSTDAEKRSSVGPDIERQRALATTPLLPPYMNDASTSSTAAPSPLESPTIVSSPLMEPESDLDLSPSLSAKASYSSFHRIVLSAELPHIPAPDAWSDRLGHANFTIEPQPYKPSEFTLDALRQLKDDWDTARVNYTKHLARTGEHYGTTSKTYAMTEEKWAEIDAAWRLELDELADAVLSTGAASALSNYDRAVLTTLPRMDAEGKFPDRGDEDIVGPMARDEVMIPNAELTDRRAQSFWRSLAGRVLRK
ncbi:only proline and serine are matching in the corresponding protein [Apiospora aurea]|uniref:Only proline and serine are matching in the corresponding protein n=1 Tax=Apiospora aurea TaxID=335848 RepID=A0ABR1Q7J5_9PEZI